MEGKPTPPIARVEPTIYITHGDRRVDNYRWLRDRTNSEVFAYLEAENRYTEAMMDHTDALQETLYLEMLGHVKETDASVPEKLDNCYYYTRTEEGRAYPIHCRKQGSLEAPEEILLDENALAVGHDYFELGVYKVSPDHRLLAYSTDNSGAELYTLRIKELDSGQLLSDEIANTYYDLEWANDNRTFFYTVLDETKRPYQVYRHIVGSDPSEDVLVYHEEDVKFFLSMSKTRSRAYLVIQSTSKTTTEQRFLPAGQPDGSFQVVQSRQPNLEYTLDHHHDEFFILTNDQAPNFRVMRVPTTSPGRENWQEMIPHRETVRITGIDAFQDHLAVYERVDGLQNIRLVDLASGESHYIGFSEPAYTCQPEGNREYQTRTLRFNYSSLVTPPSVYDYDMNDRSRELKKQQEVPGGYDPSRYRVERVWATAAFDGTRIPISLVYKKGLVRNGRSPLVLYGYGSYETSIDPGFDSNRLSLLDRGCAYAIAHVRGGGEMGRQWYEQGKLLHKRNTFTDFIACAEFLISSGYTSSNRLAIMGASAGGLLVGAVATMRPDLFQVVVAKVPFVDAINTMLDPSIPLTTAEYEEWGDPARPDHYDYIKSYSPYDNVKAGAYPHMLVTAGLNDPRVHYWEPAKWTAKLRALKTDGNLLLLKTHMAAGHGGPSGRYAHLREQAFIYAFILDRLGIYE